MILLPYAVAPAVFWRQIAEDFLVGYAACLLFIKGDADGGPHLEAAARASEAIEVALLSQRAGVIGGDSWAGARRGLLVHLRAARLDEGLATLRLALEGLGLWNVTSILLAEPADCLWRLIHPPPEQFFSWDNAPEGGLREPGGGAL
jgi:hypothetical protein